MESIPAEWFSVETVTRYGSVAAVFFVLGGYALAFSIRHKWVSLSANVETTVELAVAQEKLKNKDKEIARLKADIAALSE